MSSDNYYCGVCGEELTERDSNGMLYCGKCIPNNITQSTDTPSDTPRTDAEFESCSMWTTTGTGERVAVVTRSYARRLEREIAAARSDLECQGQAYSKALDDLATANKRLEEARKHLVVISRDSVVVGSGDDGGFGCQDSKRPSDIALLAARAIAAID